MQRAFRRACKAAFMRFRENRPACRGTVVMGIQAPGPRSRFSRVSLSKGRRGVTSVRLQGEQAESETGGVAGSATRGPRQEPSPARLRGIM